MSKIQVKDAIVFVTGANRKRGIGQSLVREAVSRGARKVYATSRDVSQLNDLVSECKDVVIPVALDVSKPEQIEQAAKEASDTQILINNAGTAGFSGFCFAYSEETARKELEVNYFGPLNMTRAFFQHLIRNHNGAIANVVSVGGLSTFPMAATYSASKAAAHSLTQATRAELAPHNVSVFGIYPGPIDTDMADGVDMEKESPANVAIRVFDGIENGVEDITTDPFADNFVERLRQDPKGLEKDFGENSHQMSLSN